MNCEELIQRINDIRKNKSYLSNAFFSKPQLDAMLAKESTQIFEGERLILLTEEQKDLIRIYFYAADNAALGEIKRFVCMFNKPVIADIVGKEPKAEALAQALVDNGFEQYSIFVRMICDHPRELNDADTSAVEYARTDDTNAIVELLNSEFDPLFSHMPPPEEITAAIKKNEITVVRKQQEIAGFAFFETTSHQNACLRYFIVNEKYRNQGIGNALLAHAFNYYGEGFKYMLWVGTYNNAMRKYERLNFKHDGLIDYILKYKGE